MAQLVNGSSGSAVEAVGHLNGFDAVVVQHEYGIYGGLDGADVLDIVEALTVPTIVVLHTVLQDPTVRQRHILLRLLTMATVVVTMTAAATGGWSHATARTRRISWRSRTEPSTTDPQFPVSDLRTIAHSSSPGV